MDKDKSQVLKGVAILMMLFWHLFDREKNVELCHNFLFVGGEPLVYFLSPLTHPVAFFLILGGYGIYKVNENRHDKNRFSRILKLYIHYWLTLIIFLAIGHFMYPERYPGAFSTIVKNFIGYNTTYNAEMWFLYPYVLLSIIAPFIFKIMSRYNWWQIMVVASFIYLSSCFCISRFGVKYLYSNMLIYTPILVLQQSFNFTLGALAAREKWVERFGNWCKALPYRGLCIWGG